MKRLQKRNLLIRPRKSVRKIKVHVVSSQSREQSSYRVSCGYSLPDTSLLPHQQVFAASISKYIPNLNTSHHLYYCGLQHHHLSSGLPQLPPVFFDSYLPTMYSLPSSQKQLIKCQSDHVSICQNQVSGFPVHLEKYPNSETHPIRPSKDWPFSTAVGHIPSNQLLAHCVWHTEFFAVPQTGQTYTPAEGTCFSSMDHSSFKRRNSFSPHWSLLGTNITFSDSTNHLSAIPHLTPFHLSAACIFFRELITQPNYFCLFYDLSPPP